MGAFLARLTIPPPDGRKCNKAGRPFPVICPLQCSTCAGVSIPRDLCPFCTRPLHPRCSFWRALVRVGDEGDVMKKTMLAGVAALAVCGATTTALAADLPPRAPRVFAPAPAIAPSFSWTGFYIGAHAGRGTARKKWSQTSPVEF